MRASVRRGSLAAAVFVSLASACVLAQTGSKSSVASDLAQVRQRLDAGAPQNLIVVLADRGSSAAAYAPQSSGSLAVGTTLAERLAIRHAANKQRVLAAFAAGELQVVKEYSHIPVSFLQVKTRAALERLLTNGDVVSVHEDWSEPMTLAESLPLIRQQQVPGSGTLGAGTAVAVLDTGVDYTRSAFGSCTAPGVPAACKVVYAHDFAPDDGKLDTIYHGTNVAGVVLGVAPGTKIVALDVFGADGLTKTSDQLSAMNWVIANHATYNIVAMNMSLGAGNRTTPATDDPRKAAVDAARAVGVLTVASSGNDASTDGMHVPGAIPGVISVGAVYDAAFGSKHFRSCPGPETSAPDRVACFSNSTWFLTMLAPGSEITAADVAMSGTSQATPHVAGAVAVLRAAYPGETLDKTVTRLTTGVMVTDPRNDVTTPRLDLTLAMGVAATCNYTIGQTGKAVGPAGGTGSVTVTAGTGCRWQAASTADWVSVTGGSSGSGNGTVSFAVEANPDVASRSAVLTVAGERFEIAQSGAVGTDANILLNSDFESGPVDWTEYSSGNYAVISTYTEPVENNRWAAWLCGYDDCAEGIYQDVTIPADAKSAYLQFDYAISTEELPDAAAYDTLTLKIFNPPDSDEYEYWELSNADATSEWYTSPMIDVSAHIGATIRVEIAGLTDAALPTAFLVDDVRLMVIGSALADTQAPSVPTGLTATVVSSSRIDLAWNASTDNVGVTAYKVYSGSTLVGTLGNVTSSTRKVSASATYRYSVAACDAAENCSANSAVAVATTPAAPDTQAPTVPTGLTATVVGSTRIDLKWSAATDNVGVTAYKLYLGGNLVATLGGDVTASSRKVAPAMTYRYAVAACDAAGNCSAASAVAVATTPAAIDGTAPTVPTGFKATVVSSTRVDLSWNAATDNVGVTAYQVYQRGALLTTLGNVTKVQLTVKPATTYSYAIAACDAAGNCSAQTASVGATTPAQANYQGLWWNPNESGWGINFSHQGDIVFATWFTYDAAGKPWWLIAELHQTAATVFSGGISTVSGPRFGSVPFGPAPVEQTVGSMTVTFADTTHATIAYTVNGKSQTKSVVPQAFGTVPVCTWGAQQNLAAATNFTDLWWNSSEAGWGVNFTHQGDIVFATWFTYDSSGKPWWLIAELRRTTTTSYAGTVSTVSGPPFDSVPWSKLPVVETTVGTATATFANGNAATFKYTVNGVTQTKSVARQVFVSPGTVCR